MRGRPPKPTELKKLAGNPGKRPLNENEPKPKPVLPKKPTHLPAEAARFWREHVPRLVELGVVTEVDGPALAMMATHYALAREAAKVLKRDGILVLDERGLERKHPLLQVMRDNSAAFRAYAVQFGLTASARARLTIAEPEEADEEFFGY
jgi:P27 family predicted phage terminase small subunit